MIPSNIGRYQIIEQVGRGRIGTVYRAHDPHFAREVAIKVIPLWDDQTLQQDFLRKTQTLISLDHPAIVPIYDFGEEDGQAFLVSKLMTGESLADRLKQGPFSLAEAATLLSVLAPALDEAHARDLFHDDLKPSNILFDHREASYLADFGIVQFYLETDPDASGSEQIRLPAYMSPEQLQKEPYLDGRSDIYALGVILFELLTGQLPYKANSSLGIALGHLNDPIPRVAAIRPELPADTQMVMDRVLAKLPDDRYPTATALSEAVMALAMGKSIAPPPMAKEALKPSEKPWQYVSAKTEESIKSEESKHQNQSVQPASRVENEDHQDEHENQPAIGSISSAQKPSFWQQNRRWGGLVLLAIIMAVSAWFFVGGSSGSPDNSNSSAEVDKRNLIPNVDNSNLISGVDNSNSSSSTDIGSTQTSQKDNMLMVYVPEGEFAMGSFDDDPNAYENEKPQRNVYLDAFWIDQTEVTKAMFARFVEESGYQTDADAAGYGLVYVPATDDWEQITGANWQHPVGLGLDTTDDRLDHYPVVQVSWNDATAYCDWAERRLPTEAEWEKAARGTDGRQYPWGNEFNGQVLNYCDETCILANDKDDSANDEYQDMAPVGTYPDGASPYGALDMSGNVWEWSADWFNETYYQSAPQRNPPGAQSGTYRILRGGSWANGFFFARAAVRSGAIPSEGIDNLGFRCAMSP